MNPIRVAVLGTGRWSRRAHIGNLLHLPEVEIVGLWEKEEDRLAKAMAQFEGRKAPPTFRSYEDLLEKTNADAVVVSLAPDQHAQVVVAALQAGKHVLCEKPLSNTLEGCHHVFEAATRSNKILQVGFEFRFSPFFQHFRQTLAEGLLGRPEMMWLKSITWFPPAFRGGWVSDYARSGGAMNFWGVHAFDLFHCFTGSLPVRIQAIGGIKHFVETPNLDSAIINIEYANGIYGSIFYCRFSPFGNDFEVGVVCERGKIEGLMNARTIRLHGIEDETETSITVAPYKGEAIEGCLQEWQHFLGCIRNERKPEADARDGWLATLVALSVERAVREKRTIELDIPKELQSPS
jgi:myo-inositol 2-dehydrogenase/D-chiro-inositol 1-dehydrogenase